MDYTAELFRACGAAVLSAFALNLVCKSSVGVGTALRVGGAVFVFGILVFVLRDTFDEVVALFRLGEKNGAVREAFSLMLKALGIATVSRFCSDICRDCGENTLANGIESVGKAVTVALSLPLLSDILEKISGLSGF